MCLRVSLLSFKRVFSFAYCMLDSVQHRTLTYRPLPNFDIRDYIGDALWLKSEASQQIDFSKHHYYHSSKTVSITVIDFSRRQR